MLEDEDSASSILCVNATEYDQQALACNAETRVREPARWHPQLKVHNMSRCKEGARQ